MSESDLVRATLDALAKLGFWAWRTNSGVAVGASGARVKLAPPGTPDILGVTSDGRLFGLEAKTPTGRVSKTQIAWAARAERHNVHVAVFRSVGEAVALVRKWDQ